MVDLEPLMRRVEAHVRDTLMPRRLARSPLVEAHARAVAELSERFTSDREALPAGYLSQPKYRAAYLLYFLPTGVATIADLVQRSKAVLPDRPIRLLDVGAGPLTASLAVALTTEQPLEVVAVDRSAATMADGVALLRALRPDVEVRTVVGNLRHGRDVQAVGGPFDLIVAGNVLNEWTVGGPKTQSAGAFMTHLIEQRLAAEGAVVLVEPGTRDGSRRLIELREEVREALPELAVLSPCLGGYDCPLARDSRDWCHGEVPWQRPAIVEALDGAMGHARTLLKSSHLVLADRPQPSRRAHTWRVIGGLMRAGETERRYLCGPEGRVVLTAPTLPTGLARAFRGELLEIDGVLQPKQGPRREQVLTLRGVARQARTR